MPVKETNNTKKVIAALHEAQEETLNRVGRTWVHLVTQELRPGTTRNTVKYEVIGRSTLVLEAGGALNFIEEGTAVRGAETNPGGRASGVPYNIPKTRVVDGKETDKPFQEKMRVQVGYKSFRRRDGRVVTIPQYKTVDVDRGRRKKMLSWVDSSGVRHFARRITGHKGVPARLILSRARYAIQDEHWAKLAEDTFAKVARRRGIAVGRLR